MSAKFGVFFAKRLKMYSKQTGFRTVFSDFLQVIEITSQIRKTDSKFSQQKEMTWLDSSFQKKVQAADEGEEILWKVIMCISFDAHSACLVGHSKVQI